MGLRTASLRRPHASAMVMAPALTDATQSQQTFSKLSGDETVRGVLERDSSEPVKLRAVSRRRASDNNNIAESVSIEQRAEQAVIEASLDLIMSSPMGDIDGSKMGLKTGFDAVSKVDELLTNLNAVLPDENLGNGGEQQTNVDDIMQVIKSMETVKPVDELFDKSLLIDDMDELDEENVKESRACDLLDELRRRQARNVRRLDFMRRRLNKVRCKLMGEHVSGEIAGVFEHVHESLRRTKDEQNESGVGEGCKALSYSTAKSLARKLQTTVILQANTHMQQRHTVHQLRYFGSGTTNGGESGTQRGASGVNGVISVPGWSAEHRNEFDKVAGLLRCELDVLTKEIDSEATESSSGGESCDEMQNYNNPHQQYLSIQKRALWKYTRDRAAIAARWTWLQSQIADLEYRIRQHTDLQKKIRSNKGAIKLDGTEAVVAMMDMSPTPSTSTVNGYRGGMAAKIEQSESVASVDECQCARTRPLLSFRKRKLLQVAGLHAVSKKAARPSTIRCDCTPPSVQSCALCTGRTDPMYPRDQPETMSKAERVAALDAGFHPVFSLMEDASQTIHLEALMRTVEWQQRSSRMKTIKSLNKSQQQQQQNRPVDHRTKEHRKKYGKLIKSSTMSALSAKIRGKMRGRRPGRQPSLNQTPNSSVNYTNSNNVSGLNNNRKRLHSLQHTNYDGNDEEMEQIEKNRLQRERHHDLRDAMDSPSTSPLMQMQSIAGFSRKNNNNRIHSYDIDNIVIPYSVAAATRVEKLQYKEILTPKWRIAEPEFFKYEVKNNGTVKIHNNTSQESDAEDMSEDSVVARHDRCEHDEKKKFLSYMKLPIGYGRQRAHKRTDSLAESSGANTPDPMSPHPVDHANDNSNTHGGGGSTNLSPITSPPATPLSAAHADDKENSNSSNSCTLATGVPSLPSVSSVLRRRTVSQSRFARERDFSNCTNENRCSTPEINEVAPYELRAFPLLEDIYDRMLKYMPENHQLQTNTRAQDSELNCSNNSSNSGGEKRVESEMNEESSYMDGKGAESPGGPDSESTESAFGDGDDEDPNDPEWFEMEHSNRDRYKR